MIFSFIFFLQYDAVNLIYVRNQIDEALTSHRYWSTHYDLGIIDFVVVENIIDFWDGGDVLYFFPSFYYPFCVFSFKCFFPSQGRTMFHWTRILCIFCQRVGSKQSDFPVQGNTILINCNDKEFNTLKQLFLILILIPVVFFSLC